MHAKNSESNMTINKGEKYNYMQTVIPSVQLLYANVIINT